MALDFDTSDILGSSSLVGRGRMARHPTFTSFFKLSALGALVLLALVVFRYGRTIFLRWKERHYKLLVFIL